MGIVNGILAGGQPIDSTCMGLSQASNQWGCDMGLSQASNQ